MFLLILVILLISSIVRLLTAPFRYGNYYRRPFFGYRRMDNYGYNPYAYGCRRHHRFLGGLFPVIVLVALDRIFGRRF